MLFSGIKPFVRYVHYLPLDKTSEYAEAVPYDNRLFFARKGSGELWVNGVLYEMPEGAVIIIPSGTKYRLITPKTSVTYIAVNFDYTENNSVRQKPVPPADVCAYDPLLRTEHVCFEDVTEFNDVVYIEKPHLPDTVFLKMYNEYSQKMIFYENAVSGLFSELLIDCARNVRTEELSGNGEKINLIIDYIKENYGKRLTNQKIGDKFNLHPNYINCIFKKFTGMSLHRFVLRVRISASAEMLSATNLSVGEIAEKCGFSDIYHFSKAFKSIMGTSPTKYN